MKKVLLMLTVCSLSITSMHAGLFDLLPTWRKTESSGVPAFPNGTTRAYQHAAQQVMNTISDIKSVQTRQNLIDSAKKHALRAIAIPAITTALARVFLSGNIESFGELLLLPSKIAMLYMSWAAGLAYAGKAGYDLIQAQRYENRDLASLKAQYDQQFHNTVGVLVNAQNRVSLPDTLHAASLII